LTHTTLLHTHTPTLSHDLIPTSAKLSCSHAGLTHKVFLRHMLHTRSLFTDTLSYKHSPSLFSNSHYLSFSLSLAQKRTLSLSHTRYHTLFQSLSYSHTKEKSENQRKTRIFIKFILFMTRHTLTFCKKNLKEIVIFVFNVFFLHGCQPRQCSIWGWMPPLPVLWIRRAQWEPCWLRFDKVAPSVVNTILGSRVYHEWGSSSLWLINRW